MICREEEGDKRIQHTRESSQDSAIPWEEKGGHDRVTLTTDRMYSHSSPCLGPTRTTQHAVLQAHRVVMGNRCLLSWRLTSHGTRSPQFLYPASSDGP